MKGLAIRRHHKARLKKKRQRYWNQEQMPPNILGILMETPCMCSCPMCGNPRRHFGLKTRQEIRAEDIEHWAV